MLGCAVGIAAEPTATDNSFSMLVLVLMLGQHSEADVVVEKTVADSPWLYYLMTIVQALFFLSILLCLLGRALAAVCEPCSTCIFTRKMGQGTDAP